eukprot:gene6238-4488_t
MAQKDFPKAQVRVLVVVGCVCVYGGVQNENWCATEGGSTTASVGWLLRSGPPYQRLIVPSLLVLPPAPPSFCVEYLLGQVKWIYVLCWRPMLSACYSSGSGDSVGTAATRNMSRWAVGARSTGFNNNVSSRGLTRPQQTTSGVQQTKQQLTDTLFRTDSTVSEAETNEKL